MIDYIPDGYYYKIHEYMVIPCIDVFVRYNNAILMIKRKIEPAKGYYWCFGGRLRKGVLEEDNVKLLVKNECGLDATNIQLLGIVRTMFKEAPYNHGKGTDSRNTVYYAEGSGEINLDDLHEKPIFVTKKKYYVGGLRNELHPYVVDFLDRIFDDFFANIREKEQ